MSRKLRAALHEITDGLLATLGALQPCLALLGPAIAHEDATTLQSLVDHDVQIDQLVRHYTERTLITIATTQPVATDLRRLGAIMLQLRASERIGDQIGNLAKLGLASHAYAPAPDIWSQLDAMYQQSQQQLQDTIHSLQLWDPQLARVLRERDLVLNEQQRILWETALEQVVHPGGQRLLYGTMMARAYERIGDLTVHIGEQTVYALEGEMPKYPGSL
jgi:phosphate transport system protein